jgi:hypothetical protein
LCYMPCPSHPPWLLAGSLITTTWRVLTLRMEETPSRHEG